ncbi:MAG: VWA domain-containing protein [Bacteroidales bacterium]|nr:VWA domain-containing protein [Bacteroidales bacterium]
MKKIYSIFLAATAAMLFAPTVNAQLPYPDKGAYSIANTIYDRTSVTEYPLIFPHDTGLQLPENLGVAYSKNVSSPLSDGTYWIKLESFATGQSSFIETAAPADIILVLDLSTSMRNSRNVYSYSAASTPSGGWTPGNINGGQYYILYEGGHYRVRRGGNNNNSRFVYFDLEDGTTCYLVNSQVQVGGTQPSVNNNTEVYNGTLYTRSQGSETRFEALQRATKDFIDVIEKNDKYEDEAGTVERAGGRLGNRISIITFNSSATTQNTLANGELKDAAGSTPSTAEQLKTLVDNLAITVQGTTPYNGFVAANAQLATINAARMLTASRTVVLFTDGEPYDSGDRWKAIGEALKTKTKDDPATPAVEGYDATVFTVGMFTNTPAENTDIWKFMNYVSSNAPNAQDINTPGESFNKNAGYYYDVSDESMDLSAVFKEIAHQSSGTTSSLNAGSRNVDVVSNSFVLPAGTTTDNIDGVVKVYTARLTGMNGSAYVFEEEILKGHTPDSETYKYDVLDADGNSTGVRKKVDADLNVSFNATTNAITVTGFDYNSNFCGPVENQQGQIDHYQGFKVIIMIPVKMNPNSVGGPNVETNGPGSGIFVNADSQTAYVPFKSPTVSLPVNIHIKKIGLYPGESAKFKIYRAVIPTMTEEEMKTWNPASLSESAWSEVSSVFVTNSTSDPNATPMIKVRGLPATITQDLNEDGEPDEDSDGNVIQLNVVYRIKEENWGWSYTVSNTLDYPNPQYTVTSNVVNPFQFKNTKKNPDRIDIEIRHAETKATNIFKTGETHGHYVDSKARE